MSLVSSNTADLSYLVLAIWALTGNRQVIQAIFMTWLISVFNPSLVSAALLGSTGRYLVIFAAAISVLLRYRVRMKYYIFITLLLGVFFVIHSLIFSHFSDVSILKSVMFIITITTLLFAWSALTPFQRAEAEMFIFGGMIIVALISLVFIFSNIGYLRNGSGFHGVLNHPQSFGPFVALLFAWIIGRFFSERDRFFPYLAMIFLCILLILASESRTSGGAILLGLVLSLTMFLLIHKKSMVKLLPRFDTKKFKIMLIVVSVIFIVFTNQVLTQLNHFYLKGGASKSTDLISALKESREGFAYKMYDNIVKNPITGIGFGIASSPNEMSIKRDPYFHLPISAPIEKGIMPMSVIEELGIPGGVLVFSWFAMLFRRAFRAGFVPFIVLSTVFMINFGENIFFSTGGMGMLTILLTTWSVSSRAPYHKIVKLK